MQLERYLNPEQRSAAETIEGPVLILAGAGSGKTRALTYRIANMIDSGISPWNILAITFTNKAAGEMRERIDDLVGFGSDSIWVATFHSTCLRILRRYADKIGYNSSFSIYDTDDSKALIRRIIKDLNYDPKQIREKTVMNVISNCKNEMISVSEYDMTATDYYEKIYSKIYAEYQQRLLKNNAMDFDDLLIKTVMLFKEFPDVLENYQNRFKYILIDEYQDTNTVQFEFVRLLADKYRNLCVVGDDDQSIYKFRGANIRNILDFEKHYADAKVIKLEQNYRSTQTILNAANAVIANNTARKNKKLWSDNGEGHKIHFRQLDYSREEAEYIADDIARRVRQKDTTYDKCAVLYRTNAQSRELEEMFVRSNIPYNIVGGQNFYGRMEIKDTLAYLKTINNGNDDVALLRIINVPKRGIGDTSINKALEYARENNISLFDAMKKADAIPGLSRAAGKMVDFTLMIRRFRTAVADEEYEDLPELIDDVLKTTGYYDEIKELDKEEGKERESNLDELITKAAAYEEKYFDENPEAQRGPSLDEFLSEVSLVADIDNVDESTPKVLLMTLHSAKGLEFDNVYIAGCEDGLFPGDSVIGSIDSSEMEEERRLAYVGITRAKQELTLTCAKCRMLRGETRYNPVSTFVREIPKEYLEGNMPKNRSEFEFNFEDLGFGGNAGFKSGNARPSGFSKPKASVKSKDIANPMNKPYAIGGLDSLKGIKGLSKGIASDQSNAADIKPGMRVKHIKFGEGTVKLIENSDGAGLVTVDFDNYGTRVLNASYARLTVI